MPQTSSPEKHGRIGFLCALLTAAVWGTMPIALKLVLAHMEAPTVVWYRFLFATVFLTIFLRLRGPISFPPRTGRRMLLLAITILGIWGNSLAFMFGLEYISPTSAQVMIQLAPLLVVVAGVTIFHEPFGGLQWVGAPMLAAGILLFFHDQLGGLFDPESSSATGILLIMLAAVTWAAASTAQKKLLPVFGSIRLMWLIYGVGLALITPLARPSQALALDAGQSWVLLYCCATTVIGYGLFSEALKLWDASRVGAVVAVTPLFTWSLTQLGSRLWPEAIAADPIDSLSMAGALAVAGGSALAALGRKTSSTPIASVPPSVSAPPVLADQSQYQTRS